MINKTKKLQKSYERLYKKSLRRAVFPNEYLIRIFMGKYPHLSDFKRKFKEKKVLDIGCGDGRNLKLFRSLGMKIYGTEINDAIVKNVARSLQIPEWKKKLKVGLIDRLPFKDCFFDYVVSWNSSYYMGDLKSYLCYEKHVAEMFRVCAPEGYVIISVPMRSHSIFANAEPVDSSGRYVCIKKDPNQIRNGIVFRLFSDRRALSRAFGKYFNEIGYASIRSLCFGLHLNWHISVFKKNGIPCNVA